MQKLRILQVEDILKQYEILFFPQKNYHVFFFKMIYDMTSFVSNNKNKLKIKVGKKEKKTLYDLSQTR